MVGWLEAQPENKKGVFFAMDKRPFYVSEQGHSLGDREVQPY